MDLVAWLWALQPWRRVRPEIVKRPEGTKGGLRLPQRRMAQRTFARLGRYRRLAKGDEFLTGDSEAVIHVATLPSMVRRLARTVSSETGP